MTLQCAGVRTEPVDRQKGPCPPLSGYSTSIGGEHYNYSSLLVYLLSLKYIRTLLICSLYCFQYGGPSLELKRGGKQTPFAIYCIVKSIVLYKMQCLLLVFS